MVNANLKRLRRRYINSEEFGEEGIIQLTHNDRLMAFSILFNINEISPTKFYKPEDLGQMIIRQMRSKKFEDSLYQQNSLLYDISLPRIGYKEIYKTLKKLERAVGLGNIQAKNEIRKIRREHQIKFSGKPSLYKFPDSLTILKRIYSNPVLSELVIKALVELGFVDDLAFFLKGVIHSIINNNQETRSKVANKVFDIVTNTYPLSSSDTDSVNISDLNPFREYLLSISEGDLNEFARKAAFKVIKNPAICMPILIPFLFRTEELNPKEKGKDIV